MPSPTRKPRICCLDLDTFFVSVERLRRPDLIGKPVVVGAMPGKRGVVTAGSYEVREFGVCSGMAIAEALRLAPHAIDLPDCNTDYSKYAARAKEILQRYAPVVRTASIDELMPSFDGDGRPGVAQAIDDVREPFGFDSIHFGMKSGSRWKRDS